MQVQILWRDFVYGDLRAQSRRGCVAENCGFDVGGWGDYAYAVAGKNGAVLFAGCVAGVEGEGKDE